MQKWLTVLGTAIAIMCFQVSSGHTAQTVELKDGTPVMLKLTQEVSSANAPGTTVNFTVTRDIVVDGYVVIAQGTPAQGTVVWSESKGRVGRAGKLQIGVDSTKAVDGTRVSLRSNVAQTGKDSETASVAMGVVCCPLFLMMKGDEAVYRPGTEFKAYVESAYKLSASELKKE